MDTPATLHYTTLHYATLHYTTKKNPVHTGDTTLRDTPNASLLCIMNQPIGLSVDCSVVSAESSQNKTRLHCERQYTPFFIRASDFDQAFFFLVLAQILGLFVLNMFLFCILIIIILHLTVYTG